MTFIIIIIYILKERYNEYYPMLYKIHKFLFMYTTLPMFYIILILLKYISKVILYLIIIQNLGKCIIYNYLMISYIIINP
ncbi:Transmembrane domain-containing protein [Orpheovirus IHUMI-LCC2]|uniref:Transmembrane domain-containing protein n=1 Tax=Orpheovirus IHUMI-LCC2 TaxID=2023057 RepID=A0A2I2L3K3_9VIRU|nr:Transmembrane domain-containing protein [Orpheovirus IHUMI-LCC2]SNW62112.1 Transmembrane domain-containing protein [Orpheovirus IHUMI-LCC2]